MQDRISAVCRVPSASTAKLGTPRLSRATVWASKGSISGGACCASWLTRSRRRQDRRPPRRSRPAGLSRRGHRSPAPAASAAGAGRRRVPTRRPTASRPAPTLWPGQSSPAGGRARRYTPDRLRASTALVKALRAGPPRAIRTSGRLESTSRWPYRGLSAPLQVAVTPARTSATISSRASGPDIVSAGDTTSATAIARTDSRHPDPHPRRRGQAEPAVGGVVQRPQVPRGVHRAGPVCAATRNRARRRRPPPR